jgi:hypothetical protein
MGSKIRDRLVGRGMIRWSGREIATSVLWCAVAEPCKKGGEALLRLISAFGCQLSYPSQ